ncbi:MAG TPA: hypothetical protein VF610_13590 [Segetibacter sp.]
MIIQILKPDIKIAVRRNVFLRADLMHFNRIGDWTLDQWRLNDKDTLTTLDNLAIIRRHLKLDDSAVLTEPLEVDDNGKPVAKAEPVHS